MNISDSMRKMLKDQSSRIAIIVVATILVILALFGVLDAVVSLNKVHNGISVAGLYIGRQDKDAAKASVSKFADKLENREIKIEYKGKAWMINAKDLDFQVDERGTVDKAFKIGRDGLFKSIAERFSLWFVARDVGIAFNYRQDKLDRIIGKISKFIDNPAEDAQIKVIEGRVTTTPHRNGIAVEKKLLSDKIINAFTSKRVQRIEVPTRVLKPDITEAHLNSAKKMVREMVKAPLSLKYKEHEWEVSVRLIAEWIDFSKVREGDHWSLTVVFDKDKINKYLEEVTKGVVIEAKDAQFKIENDQVTIVPSSDGLKVNLSKAYDDILDASKSKKKREVLLSMETAKPKLTTEEASKMGIKEKVSSFTTFFNPAQASRVHNIRLLGSTLDGKIVAPGEIFSFNGAMGPRTAEKGYKEAPAIINGKLVPSLGGGVCQVGTTLFNAIFFGGYEVIERHNHSFYISHYPLGRDATVSWGGPDLKFKNDTSAYILIKVKTTASSITIDFYSTNQGVKVEYTTEGPSNFRDVAPQIIEDPSLPQGVTKQEEEGERGCQVIVYRTVYKNGTVTRQDKFVSKYVPKKAIIRVGTGAGGPPPPVPEATSTVEVVD
ncbi:MAG: VanW family protein [Firmicutes bacterium]|nr:VanW family protein [Bacillota bacterium]